MSATYLPLHKICNFFLKRVMDLMKQSGIHTRSLPPKISSNIKGAIVSIDHLPTADDFSSGEGSDTTDDDERPVVISRNAAVASLW